MSEVKQLSALETQRENENQLIEARRMALRLADNYEFRKLILEGFCEKEAARYVQASADPALKPEERADALAMAQASGHLKRYLSIIVQMGAHAERTRPELDAAIEDERASGSDEGELV